MGPVLKRPAAASQPGEIYMDDVWQRMRKDVGSLSRGAFLSRAYDNARRRMKAAGRDDSACKRFAQSQLQEAASLWASLHS